MENLYQYFISIKLSDGQVIDARSPQNPISVPIKVSKEEAEDRLLGILSFELLGESDPQRGRELLKSDPKIVISRREGVVYYRPV